MLCFTFILANIQSTVSWKNTHSYTKYSYEKLVPVYTYLVTGNSTTNHFRSTSLLLLRTSTDDSAIVETTPQGHLPPYQPQALRKSPSLQQMFVDAWY